MTIRSGVAILLFVPLTAFVGVREHPASVRYFEASARLDRLAAAAAPRGAPPRRSDPEVAAALAIASDGQALFGGRSFGPDDARDLFDIMTPARARSADRGAPRRTVRKALRALGCQAAGRLISAAIAAKAKATERSPQEKPMPMPSSARLRTWPWIAPASG